MALDLEGRRVTLIGGAGFIGHHLALALRERGADVHVIDALAVNNLGSHQADDGDSPHRSMYLDMLSERLDLLRAAEIPVHVQDACDHDALTSLLDAFRPTAVVHLAAVAHAQRAAHDPRASFDNSVLTLQNTLEWARGHTPHVVYFSSSLVYGRFRTTEVTEDARCEPVGVYGTHKYCGERLVRAYHDTYGLPYTVIRTSALYGERCVSRRVGQVFIESALRGGELRIDGDGTSRLDFTYIGDLVDGTLRVLRSPAAHNQTFNLTFGSSRSLSELVDVLIRHFPDLDVRYGPGDAATPERGTLAIDKARRLLGFEPRYPLEEGFISYIDWYRQRVEAHATESASPNDRVPGSGVVAGDERPSAGATAWPAS